MPEMSARNVLLMLAACAAFAATAIAEDFKAGPITVEQPWARASIGEAANSAAYMRIENAGDAADRLVAVKTDAAETVMLHESRMEGDVMKMVHLADGIEIPAHGSAELKPLGLHVMLMGLKQPLKAGETLPLTLVFEKQGEVAIKAKVGKGAQ
jgi:copper(I)-binding protein